MEASSPGTSVTRALCPLVRLIDAIGGRWKILLLWQLSSGVHRYGELLRAIDGISERMLVQQLRALEADGLVSREQYAEVPPRVEYALTERGHSLVPLLAQLGHWSMDHLVTADAQAA
jgi:DNA-binding HxlR family transcriptional regulator